MTEFVSTFKPRFCGFMAQIDFVFVAYAEIPNKGRSFFKCGFWRWCSSSDARQTPEFEEDGKKPAPSPPAGAGSKKEDTHSGFWGETCGFITDLYDPKDSKPDIGGRDFSRNLFRHMNLAGAIPIMIGASFAFACAGQCFMQVVAILDRKKCGLKALNITTATLADPFSNVSDSNPETPNPSF
ncbi:uncharacterized protein LOC134848651 [Symsagittifera roscoffensis]|uniref:uncharacterized protein LOC134848651 n=1 Tax=Symsagittifera roscoffensis TaxID=84072 RepID=UPI00307C7F6E